MAQTKKAAGGRQLTRTHRQRHSSASRLRRTLKSCRGPAAVTFGKSDPGRAPACRDRAGALLIGDFGCYGAPKFRGLLRWRRVGSGRLLRPGFFGAFAGAPPRPPRASGASSAHPMLIAGPALFSLRLCAVSSFSFCSLSLSPSRRRCWLGGVSHRPHRVEQMANV